jgi:voltage-gated potassium channel
MGYRLLKSILDPESRMAAARAFRLIHHLAVALSLAAAIEVTARSPPLERSLLADLALLAAGLFLAEWLLRLVAAPALSVPPGRPWARLRYLLSFLGLVDLVSAAALPAALLLGVPLELAVTAAVLPILKLTRYVAGFSLIGRVLRNERGTLLGVLAAFAMVLLLAGTAQYLLEHEAQPATFGSVGASLWWCIVTLTTAGYGDAIPVTAAGRMLAGLVMVLGIAVFALWAGIIASGFAAEMRRHDFLRTWTLVAQVPLFRALGAGVIAEVARCLRPRQVPAGATVVRKGDPGDCMYFIVAGEVEVALQARSVRLVAGDFLGEMALITGEPRRATVTAVSQTRLLTLDIADFRLLAGQHPELTRAIEEEAARRGAGASASP